MTYSPRFSEAVELAMDLHRDQRRKGTDVPYVTHLFAVASLVGENGGGETEVIAALLHDAVEDQGGHKTLDLIRESFGERVAEIVAACSDSDEQPKPPWKERKQAFIDRMRQADRSVLLVVAADKLHNARCTLLDLRVDGPSVFKRFGGKRTGTLWYYNTLLEIFQQRLDAPLVRALAEVVKRMEVESE